MLHCHACAELNEKHAWRKLDYARNFIVSPSDVAPRDTVERIDALVVSELEFIEKYERTYRPVVILNCQRNWAAPKVWTLKVYDISWGPWGPVLV